MVKLVFTRLDLNLLAIFVQNYLNCLNKNNKNIYVVLQNFTHILTQTMPKSSLWMLNPYFALKFKYFSLKLSSKIFMHFCQLKVCLHFQPSSQVRSIDIERKNRLLKVWYVPTTSTTFLAFFPFFLLWPLTVLMKQTRQVVCAVKQSIFLKCLWSGHSRSLLTFLEQITWLG